MEKSNLIRNALPLGINDIEFQCQERNFMLVRQILQDLLGPIRVCLEDNLNPGYIHVWFSVPEGQREQVTHANLFQKIEEGRKHIQEGIDEYVY